MVKNLLTQKSLDESAQKFAEIAPSDLGNPGVLKNKLLASKLANTVDWACYETLSMRFPDDPWYVTEVCDWNNTDHACVDNVTRNHLHSFEWRHHVGESHRNWPFSCSVKTAENHFGLDCSKWKNRVKLGL